MQTLKYFIQLRFLEKNEQDRDLHIQVSETSDGQFPYAVVLSCIDSRVPVELVFDQGVGDIFSARVAGNIINEDILGSIEYACGVAGSKAILVLGHTKCGAVTAACIGVCIYTFSLTIFYWFNSPWFSKINSTC